jgi:hypothetical protein
MPATTWITWSKRWTPRSEPVYRLSGLGEGPLRPLDVPRIGPVIDAQKHVAKLEAGYWQLDLTAADVAAVVLRNVTLNRALIAK